MHCYSCCTTTLGRGPHPFLSHHEDAQIGTQKKMYFGWSQDNYFTSKFPSLNVNKHTAAAAVRLKAALQPDAVCGSGLILCSDLFQSFAHLGPWN